MVTVRTIATRFAAAFAAPLPPLSSDEGTGRLHPIAILAMAAGCLLAALAANAARHDGVFAVRIFYAGVALAFLPGAACALAPSTSAKGRFETILAITIALYVLRVIREPAGFIDHDEFLHWTTAEHILESGRLFSANALLPVSPRYPGLEIIATALSSLSGLGMFAVSVVLFAICRLLFIALLYFAYERLSGRAIVAACGCLVYMGASTFFVFDTQFSYESLGVVFVAALLMLTSRLHDDQLGLAAVSFIVIAALAMTHHMTAYFGSALVVAWALFELIRRPRRVRPMLAVALAAFALAAPLAWSKAMGNPGSEYLGPVLTSGAYEAAQLLMLKTGRHLFQSTDGYVAPLWQRIVTLGSVAILCAGLAAGFLMALRSAWPRDGVRGLRHYRAGLVIVLTLTTLFYPMSMVFRLTQSGWEIGNRIGPFSFIGVGFVVACAVAALQRRGRLQIPILAAAGTVILVGGIISAEGPRILVPGAFRPASDSASIGAIGIDAAKWTRQHLGARNLFASDRINRLLISTYGRQDVTSTLQDGYDMSDVMLAPKIGRRETTLMRQSGVDYFAIDLRITEGLPGVGGYFDGGERDRDYLRPPLAATLLKFDTEAKVGRVFDDGYIFIYDTRTLDGTR